MGVSKGVIMNVKNLRFALLYFLIFYNLNAQVGVGNTNPQASLDITASSTTSPANNDGILIPRMSSFPSSPAAAQDGMLIFYTGAGASGKGFYYWNHTSTNWVKIASGDISDIDWYEEGTSTAPDDINDNIYTLGKVALGTNTNNANYNFTSESLSGNSQILLGNTLNNFPGAQIEVTGSGADGLQINLSGAQNGSDRYAIEANLTGGLTSKLGFLNGAPDNILNGLKNQMVMGGSLYSYNGLHNNFSGTTTNNTLTHRGLYNYLTGTVHGYFRGVENRILGSGSGNKIGLYNFFGTSSGQYLIGHLMDVSGSNSTASYIAGLSVSIPSTVTANNQYGVYSDVTSSNGYSGYFLGRVSIGTTTSNNYTLPSSRGTNNQVMQTNASGNTSWVDPSTLFSVSANNGTNYDGSNVQLGGALTENTTITQGTRSLDINLNSTGDFAIQDAGSDVFFVEDTGDIGIGTSNPSYQMHIVNNNNNAMRAIFVNKDDNSSNSTDGIFVAKTSNGTGRNHGYYSLVNGTGNGNRYGLYTDITGTGTGQKYGVFNELNINTSGSQYAVRNWVRGASGSNQFGVFNNMDNANTADIYGVYNGMRVTNASNMYGIYNEFQTPQSSTTITAGVRNRFTNGTPGSQGFSGIYTDFALAGNGTYFGVRNEYGAGSTGTGTKYGTYNLISSSAGGTHFGTYNSVSTSSGWAGYFIGKNYISSRLSIGELDNPNSSLNILINSGSSSHIELKENQANDGSRLRFTNASETNNRWTLYGRADNTDSDSVFNFFHNGNILQIFGDNQVQVNGQFSVNLANPTYAIHLPNNSSIGNGRGRANAWTTYSDGRIKSNQALLTNGLSLILRIQPKTYFHHDGNFEDNELVIQKSGEQTIGFIAQELYNILPEAVQKPVDENNELWSINYEKIIPFNVRAIQELNSKIENLEAENLSLKQQLSKLQQLEERLLALENRNTNNVTETASVIGD